MNLWRYTGIASAADQTGLRPRAHTAAYKRGWTGSPRTHCWRATGHSSCCRGSTFLVVAVRIVHSLQSTCRGTWHRPANARVRTSVAVKALQAGSTRVAGCYAEARVLGAPASQLGPQAAATCTSACCGGKRRLCLRGLLACEASGEDLALDARGRAEPVQHVPSRRGAGRRLVHAVRVVGLAQDAVLACR